MREHVSPFTHTHTHTPHHTWFSLFAVTKKNEPGLGYAGIIYIHNEKVRSLELLRNPFRGLDCEILEMHCGH